MNYIISIIIIVMIFAAFGYTTYCRGYNKGWYEGAMHSLTKCKKIVEEVFEERKKKMQEEEDKLCGL